jgi:hypothetical protein
MRDDDRRTWFEVVSQVWILHVISFVSQGQSLLRGGGFVFRNIVV